jgi:hypothetical protein
LSVPAHQSLWSYFDEVALHCRRYEVEGLRSRCLDAGFEVEYATEFMSFLYPLMKNAAAVERFCAQENRQEP